MSTITYKIPKLEVKAEMLISSETRAVEYVLYLNQFSRHRKGEETISEFLNKGKHFLPIKNAANNKFVIVNTNEVVYVKEMAETGPVTPTKLLMLHFRNNTQLRVEHFQAMPDAQSRVADYLNNDPSLFILFYHNNKKVHVNKNFLIKVVEL